MDLSAALSAAAKPDQNPVREGSEATFMADVIEASAETPVIAYFTATWCGPCAAVRRVVDQVCADLPAVAHVEIDLDANPDAARRLSVLSLPTPCIFDAAGRQRYRSSGVPKAADLRAAVEPLLA